jgi:hypothetical protein
VENSVQKLADERYYYEPSEHVQCEMFMTMKIRNVIFWVMKMEAVSSSKMLLPPTRLHSIIN